MSVRGSDENLYNASSDSFWDIGNYKRTVKRIDDGAKLCDDFMKLVCERAEIEARYSFKLKAWAKKWDELIKNGPEYANMEAAMRGTVSEAEARSELHVQCRDRLMENVNEALKKWKQENYHKGIFQWKETKEADEGFAKAQKPWAKRLGKVLKAKKAYHIASRSKEDAVKRESEVNRDSEKSAEKVKKLQEASEKAKREMDRCKEKYQLRLNEITEYNPTYEQDMSQEFRKCQASEEGRLEFFKGSLVDYHRCLNISESPELTRMFANMIATFQRAHTEQNLDWWSKNHGVDMPQYWPVFEEHDDPPLSRRPTLTKGVQPSAPSEPPASFTSNNMVYGVFNNHVEDCPVYQDSDQFSPASPEPSEPPGYMYDSPSKWEGEPAPPIDNDVGVPMRAMYNFDGQEQDELSFKEGDIITKISESDSQGWCQGRFQGNVGHFPDAYVEPL